MFIFNHRNNFDPVITSALVRDNFTGVGKKELESDPVVGTLGKLMDAVFIDRDDAKSAVEELHKVEDLARKGLSVVMAPEGTRLDTTEVGPFKKGPFRIAMAAGIPIVPVVIRNAQVIGARDSSTMNPGTVDVAVFPPISVDDWTVDNLAERTRRHSPAVPGHAEGLAGRRTSRRGPVPEDRRRQEGTRQEGRGQEAPAKKVPAKKTAAKKTARRSRQEGGREEGCRPDGPRDPTGTAVKDAPEDFDGYDITGDALVLASVSSPAELDLLNDWVSRQRRDASRRRHRGAATAR